SRPDTGCEQSGLEIPLPVDSALAGGQPRTLSDTARSAGSSGCAAPLACRNTIGIGGGGNCESSALWDDRIYAGGQSEGFYHARIARGQCAAVPGSVRGTALSGVAGAINVASDSG